jgi:prepilin-type N-terminal cleavage/methylation domain-containing protein
MASDCRDMEAEVSFICPKSFKKNSYRKANIRGRKGLTLIEVLVSITMIGIIASVLAVMLPRFLQINRQSSREETAVAAMQEISEDIKAQWKDSDRYDENSYMAQRPLDPSRPATPIAVEGFELFDTFDPSTKQKECASKTTKCSSLEWGELKDGEDPGLKDDPVIYRPLTDISLENPPEEVADDPDPTEPDADKNADPVTTAIDDSEPDIGEPADEKEKDPKEDEDGDGYEDNDSSNATVAIPNRKRIKITLVPAAGCTTTRECAPKVLVFDIGRPAS